MDYNVDTLLEFEFEKTFLPALRPTEAQAAACVQQNEGPEQTADCLVRAMLDEEQLALYDCADQTATAVDLASCATGVPLSDWQQTIASCTGAIDAGSKEQLWECMRAQIDPAIAKAVDCGRALAQGTVSSCASVVGVDETTAEAVDCALRSEGEYEALLVCAAASELGENEQRWARCALSNGDAVGTVFCAEGHRLGLNPEQQIAASCAISTGGEPFSFASCAGGRLTVRELQKCISGGVGTSDGCFGKNNEIIKAARAVGDAFEEAGRMLEDAGEFAEDLYADVEEVWEGIENDIVHGPGRNNDIRKGLREFDKGVQNLANDVGREAGQAFENVGRELSNAFNSIF